MITDNGADATQDVLERVSKTGTNEEFPGNLKCGIL